jgi:hypothetical protein
MNYSSSGADGGVLCHSDRSGATNSERAGNDDEEFLEDGAGNQGPHILTLLTVCADGADSLLTSVIPHPLFLFLGRQRRRWATTIVVFGHVSRVWARKTISRDAQFVFIQQIGKVDDIDPNCVMLRWLQNRLGEEQTGFDDWNSQKARTGSGPSHWAFPVKSYG